MNLDWLHAKIEAVITDRDGGSDSDVAWDIVDLVRPVMEAAEEMRTSIGGTVGRDFAHKAYDAALKKASAL